MKRSKPDESEDDDGGSSSSGSEDDGPALPGTAAAARASALAEKANKKKEKDEKRRAKRQKTKLRTLAHSSLFLKRLPSADQYEKSYMHRDLLSHVIMAPNTGFLVTASIDGHVKFWKKVGTGIEFVKHFRAHANTILSVDVSHDGLRMVSSGTDSALKFFDVVSFDMVQVWVFPLN